MYCGCQSAAAPVAQASAVAYARAAGAVTEVSRQETAAKNTVRAASVVRVAVCEARALKERPAEVTRARIVVVGCPYGDARTTAVRAPSINRPVM